MAESPPTMTTRQIQARRTLRALGIKDLPGQLTVDGVQYEHCETFKHDFFAATGRYAAGDGDQVVLKVYRRSECLGMPLEWLGQWMACRESRIYQLLHDLPGIPRWRGWYGRTGFVHEFIPGHNLHRKAVVDDDFFPRLADLLAAMHDRQVAYVDLNKAANILQGDDGRPYLIDFQISLDVRGPWPRNCFVVKHLFKKFAQADLYHFAKHQRRLRPDQMTQAQIDASYRTGWAIRLHRSIARPLTLLRRRTLARIERAAPGTVEHRQ